MPRGAWGNASEGQLHWGSVQAKGTTPVPVQGGGRQAWGRPPPTTCLSPTLHVIRKPGQVGKGEGNRGSNERSGNGVVCLSGVGQGRQAGQARVGGGLCLGQWGRKKWEFGIEEGMCRHCPNHKVMLGTGPAVPLSLEYVWVAEEVPVVACTMKNAMVKPRGQCWGKVLSMG